MKPLNVEQLARRLEGRPLLVFTDFDGTLAEHRPDGDRSIVDPETRSALAALRARRGARVAVVSGRPVPELRARVGVKRLLYAGNHGLELEGDGQRFRHPMSAAIAASVGAASALLRRALRPHPGAVIDDNKLTLSVNVGLVAPPRRRAVKRVLDGLKKELAWLRLRRLEGHLGWELLPEVDWDKGSLVARLAGRWPRAVPLALGDGLSDEPMFRRVASRGVGVRVGRTRTSAAGYWLSGPKEVSRLLARLSRS